MAPPYRAGDSVAWIGLDDDGVRVYRAEVLEIDRDLSGWSVETSHGHEWVDDTGEGSQVVPIDDQLDVDLDRKGDGFLVRSTVEEIEQNLNPTLNWDDLANQLRQERERDDEGWER